MQTLGSCTLGRGLQAPVCDTATAGDLGLTDHLTQESQKMVSLEPICLRAAEQRRCRSSSTLPFTLPNYVSWGSIRLSDLGLPLARVWSFQELYVSLWRGFGWATYLELEVAYRPLRPGLVDIQVTVLSSRLQWQKKDGDFTRLHPQVPQTMKAELWNSPHAGEYIFFDEPLVFRAVEQVQVNVSLRSNCIMLDTLARP